MITEVGSCRTQKCTLECDSKINDEDHSWLRGALGDDRREGVGSGSVASTALSAFGASVWVPWHDDWAAGGWRQGLVST